MTRGQIAIITPEGNILSSREFNGDMYLSNGGYGEEVFGDLALADTVEDYISIVEQFNDRYFGYKEELFYNPPKSFLDMKHDYFDKWFSDYVYIKNLSESPVVFIDQKGRNIRIDTDAVAVFHYGEFYVSNEEDFEKLSFMDDLSEFKYGLG